MIRVLQIFGKNQLHILKIPDYIQWTYIDDIDSLNEENQFDLCFLFSNIEEEQKNILLSTLKAYTLFIVENFILNESTHWLNKSRRGQFIKYEDLQDFLFNESIFYFSESYGEKFEFINLSLNPKINVSVKWHGNCCVSLQGDFGGTNSQIAYWRNNIPIHRNQTIELWLEYDKSDNIDILLKVVRYKIGSVSEIDEILTFNEIDLQNIIYIPDKNYETKIFISIYARGNGYLNIIGLHDRYSRKEHGEFLPGGKRKVTNEREEVFYYFEPGDLRPPLTVYFSGYKLREGFEAYNLLRKFKTPFLLISESRLEGGGFYLGNDQFESMIVNTIQDCMNELGFIKDQVIFAGVSMGAFGALYYSCDINPNIVLIGKPLASLGDIAKNERVNRPGGFPTSLDVLWKNCKGMSDLDIQLLNNMFWDKFDRANWRKTKFLISYMIEDDYENTAFYNIISHINKPDVTICGKGFHGRHNDNTNGVIEWFVGQYKRALIRDYDRINVEED